MTRDSKLFTSGYVLFPKPRPIEIADGTTLQGLGSGAIKLTLTSRQDAITVSDVLYIPSLATNLLSVSHLEDCNITISTSGGMLKLHLKGHTIATAARLGGSYVLSSLERSLGHVF
jgi:hypothetical protein